MVRVAVRPAHKQTAVNHAGKNGNVYVAARNQAYNFLALYVGESFRTLLRQAKPRPAPSAIIFCFSISARMAAHTWSSVTETTPSTYFLHSSKVCSPGFFYCNAVRNGGNGVQHFNSAVLKGLYHAGRARRLNAVNFNAGVERFYGECHARNKTAAANGHNNGVPRL